MRIGVVGAGRMGRWHALNLAASGAGDSLLVHDTRLTAAKHLAEAVDGKACPSLSDLICDVDAVVIATPADERMKSFETAVSAGLPVFCEKPLAASAAQARQLADMASQACNARIQIGFQRRCDPGFRAARALVKAGDMGRLLFARATAFDHVPPREEYTRSSGDIFADCLIHDIDAVHWLTGLTTASVQADETLLDEQYAVATIVMALSDGTRAVLTASRMNPYGYDHRMELLGTLDSVAVGLEERTPLNSALTSGARTAERPVFSDFTDRFAVAYEEEMRTFRLLAAEGGPSVCTTEDAVAAQEVAEAAALAARTGARVAPTKAPAYALAADSPSAEGISQA
jgi:myo-inositol 2-dehydrogenase/D-chiro-inositol 1-dehydrogenase